MSRIQSTDQSTTSSFSTSLESYSPSLSDSSELSVTVDHDPAVIVGLACRVPGARNPSQLWSLIEEQRDVQRKMPADRFNVDGFYHPNSANKGTTNAKYGYFLDQDIGEFDAGFFNISGVEAEAMDPQQRILLEVVYEALEDAGIPIDSISNSQTSVFCGSFTNDYNAMTTKDLQAYPKYTVTGTGNSILANRISYFYNLHGPSATIDTACSSSLVCFHMGNQSIRNNESDISIVVGSALHFDPNIFITMTDLGMLSSDGRCRAFDASGSGYVRGEGVCAAILKRKSRADCDGDPIRAIVRGTAANHDGRKQGITLPSAEAQEELIRRTYRAARVNPADTQYFEAHGTGTAAGDPRETRAIGAVFSANREQPLNVGSVKTNIGHLEGASGLAGIIKATLSLENQKIPPNMHFKSPNPQIKFDDWKITVPTTTKDWNSANGIRRASINSFGYGGTNAHVILEGYQHSKPIEAPLPASAKQLPHMSHQRPLLIPLSSHSENGGKLLCGSLVSYLEQHPDTTPQDLAYSLSVRRSMHRYRSFAIGNDKDTIAHELTTPQPIAAWTSTDEARPRLGFIMTGQGAQWFAMGRQLILESPLFRQTLEKCDDILQHLTDKPEWSIVEELLRSKETSRLAQTQFSQPICTALQLAILDLIEQWGIKPSAVVGHSSGEMAAAYAAGILTFENAIVAAYYRGLYMCNAVEGMESKPGAMMAVGMSESEALAELKMYKGRIAMAAINSPSTMTLSGDEDAILELKEKLDEKKTFARQLQVAQAFHSHHMHPLAPGYRKALENCPAFEPQAAKLRMFSSVTARTADSSKMGPSYWTKNMESTVRFSDALTGIVLDDMDQQNVDILVEIGPHPALKGPSRQVLQSLKVDIPYLASLTRAVPDLEGLLALAGQLFMHGYPVDLVAANSHHYIGDDDLVCSSQTGRTLKTLPSYSWDHRRYWAETRMIRDHRLRPQRHALLGAPLPGSIESQPVWRNFLRLNELPWLSEHVIEGKTIFPAAGYISMAIEAVARLTGNLVNIKNFHLRDVAVKAAMTLSDKDAGTEVLLQLRPSSSSTKTTSDTWYEFTVFSFDEHRELEHCRGLIAAEQGSPAPIECIRKRPSFAELEGNSNRQILLHKYYQSLESLGLQYGESFKLISGDIQSGPGFAMAPLSFRQYQISAEPADISILHPTVLDASVHVIFAAIESQLGRPLDEPFIPTFLRSMKVSGVFTSSEAAAEEQKFKVCADTTLSSPRTAINDVRIHSNEREELLIDIQGLQLTALGGDTAETGNGRSLFFRTRWQPAFDFLGSSNCLSSIDGISKAMDLYAHQHPNSQILHFTPNVDSSKQALRLLGGYEGQRRRFQSYTPYPASTGQYGQLLDTWAPGLINLEEPKENQYDVVIVEGDVGKKVERYVKPGGYVISSGSVLSTETLVPLFSTESLNTVQKVQESSHIASPLTLVVSSAASPRTKAIESHIRAVCSELVKTVTLAQLAHQSEITENIIILASIDEDLYFECPDDNAEQYDSVQRLLTRQGHNVVWLLEGATMEAQKPEHAIISGLARSARSENDQLRLVILDVTQGCDEIVVTQRLMQLLDPGINEDEVTERNGTLLIPRIEADDMLNAKLPNGVNAEPRLEKFGQKRPLALKIGRVGLLETLVFGDDEKLLDTHLGEDEIEIEVKASAINFRDIAAAMGIIEDYQLGDECSGVVIRTGTRVDKSAFQAGDRVVAWRPGQGAHCSIVRNPASLCFKLGEMAFGVAAAMPLILTTAHYSLMDVARLQPGETVLIHSAAGGVGQMAVQIAHMVGAKVLATVGSQAKRDLMKYKFFLADDQMFSSRDDSFVAGVMAATNGRGVDVALNSLAGKLLHATWECIAPFGRFIEIGKRDIHENSKIQMDPFRVNVTFASVDLITMFERNKILGARVFQECCRLVHEGAISPPESITELSYAEAQKGFRLLQMGKHTGKVVLVPSKEDEVPVLPPGFRNSQIFDPSKTYLLIGGLGGLGRTVAEWMVRKGAKSLAFLSRSGAETDNARATVAWLKTRNVHVLVCRGDVAKLADVQACIEACGRALGGIFQAAMALKDAPFDQMTYKEWNDCLRPKVHGTHNLHKATLQSPLDFFICFSSVSAILGSKAQANYSAANAYCDALMRHRREIGLRGTTMNCGMIVGVGAVAEDAALQRVMERIGYDAVNEQELLFQIEEAVTADHSITSSSRGLDEHQTITGVNLQRRELFWAEKPLFRNLYLNHDFDGNISPQNTTKNIGALLRTVTEPAECIQLLTAAFIEKVAAVLGVAAEIIQPRNPLSAYGLDSIVAVEFRKWFSKAVGVDLALFDVLGSKSINALVTKAASLIKTNQSRPEIEGDKPIESVVQTGDNEQEQGPKPGSPAAIARVKRPEEIPMSTFQRRLWFLHNLNEDKTALSFPVIFRLKGQPNIAILHRALIELTIRNESLRTAYYEGNNFAQQEIVDRLDLELSYDDFSSEREPLASLDEHVAILRNEELDIEEGEVFRAALAKLNDTEYALVLIFHHIAIDRGSSKSFLSQLSSLYDGIRNNRDIAAVPAPEIQYPDFSVWHNAQLQSLDVEIETKYWKEKLTGAPGASKLLPFAKSERPPQNDNERAAHTTTLGLSSLNRLKRVCSRMNVTPFQFLLTAFRCFLYRYTEEKDLTILMIDGNRPHPDLEEVLGFFVNMIPLRCVNDCEAGFDDVLEELKDVTLEAMAHSKVPFDVIADAVDVEKSASHFPLGQIVLNYQMHGKMPNYPTQDFDINDVISSDIPTSCELNLEILEDPSKGLDLRLEYSTTLYDSQEMDRFLDNFLSFLTSAVMDHRQPIPEIAMCGETELKHLEDNFWATDITQNTWDGDSVLGKIIENAKINPYAVALHTSEEENITYDDLLHQARKVAFTLRRMGATPGQYIGLFSRPGIEAVVGMLGILLTRCGFICMDPDFAIDRLAFMVSDSKAHIVLFGQGLQADATDVVIKSALSPQTIGIAEAATNDSMLGLLKSASPEDPFYVIYTSGSTGKPKGVVLTQSNTQQMLSTLHHDYGFNAQDNFLHQSSICFDLSIVQIFSALTAGARVCIASVGVRKDPVLLARYMQISSVTVTYFTPSQFALLLEYALEALQNCVDYRVAFFAGERLPVRVAKAFYDLGTPAVLYNTWSPSELVVQTTIHQTGYPEAGCCSIPIGYPLANCRHYIVDSCLNPLPAGIVGEICVSGPQVGAGYLNNPKANAKSFLPNPFCSTEDSDRGWTRIFRTGDRGRFRPDGQLEFHGRIAGDKQIKLRGYRIDLGEVEQRAYLEASSQEGNGIVDISVVARALNAEKTQTAMELPGDNATFVDERQLIAFIVPRHALDAQQAQKFATTLHEKIGRHLNAYMLPNGYQFLDNLPVTIGGKVDRQNLLGRDLDLILPTSVSSLYASSDPVAQGLADTKMLQSITGLFREVLKLRTDHEIAPSDSFFSLGGQSILLLRLQAKIKRSFKVTLTLADLFKAPTPAGVYDAIASKLQAKKKGGRLPKVTEKRINWSEETSLPKDIRFRAPNNSSTLNKAGVSNILLTGVDSFIGVHMLEHLLSTQTSTTIHLVGTQSRLEHGMLVDYMMKYHLFSNALTEEVLHSRVRYIPGVLSKPHFGLNDSTFNRLGREIQAIYHFGGQMSLLKTYTDLKPLNVSAALDVIELAACGEQLTEINHLSTWSVPHLQTWKTTRRSSTSILTKESSPTHFSPPATNDFGYFKSRWVSEMLMTEASNRGFRVSIYRAPAVTASTATRVSEPADDFIRRMFLGMVESGCAPDIGRSDPQFAVDFVPVNYLVATMCKLATSDHPAIRNKDLSIYHLSNPEPLPLSELPRLMGDIRGDGLVGRRVSLESWFNQVSRSAKEDDQLRWTVLKDYLKMGHVMFALDRTETDESIRLAGGTADCPPVDASYLKGMLGNSGDKA